MVRQMTPPFVWGKKMKKKKSKISSQPSDLKTYQNTFLENLIFAPKKKTFVPQLGTLAFSYLNIMYYYLNYFVVLNVPFSYLIIIYCYVNNFVIINVTLYDILYSKIAFFILPL